MKRFFSFFRKKAVPEWLREIRKGDIAIDCGANVGEITSRLAERGAEVYAFEPNPYAYDKLVDNTRRFKRVRCLPKAVAEQPGKLKLYLHRNAEQDQVHWSTGSSLLPFKRNVNQENYVEVECVDLCEFIRNLSKPVKLLKMDVEGVEPYILRKLLDTGLAERIGKIYVEMHDAKIPEIREISQEIRRIIREKNYHHIDLTWK